MKQSQCNARGCRRLSLAKGWCNMHYKRWRSYGDAARGHKYRSAGVSLDLYTTWLLMRRRCHKPNSDSYKNYGGRGIKVCQRWRNSYIAFIEDMGERPAGYTLNRRDNNGDYTPENCHWASRRQQARNTRTNHLVEFAGRTQSVTEWAEERGINRGTLSQRLSKGWPVEQALRKEKYKHHKPNFHH